jgi:eukaryotic translation initiation factor 2C
MKRLLQQLRTAGSKTRPQLIVVVLPENGNDIYTAVKQ